MFSRFFTSYRRALFLVLSLCFFANLQSAFLGLKPKGKLDEQSPTAMGFVTMSVAPYRFIVDFLSDKKLACSFIVPPQSDPHHFEPTLSHLADLRRADLILVTGEPCERQLLTSLQQDQNALVLDLRSTCSLLPAPSTCHHHQSGGHKSAHLDCMDTHLWLSPKRLIEQTRAIEGALKERFPAFQELFASKGKELVERLAQLDRSITSQLQDLKIRALLVSHPALTYFCDDYGLDQLSAEAEGRHPTPRQQTRLLSEIKKRQIAKIIVIQPHSEKAARQIAKNLNLEIACINPYGEDPIAFMENLCTLLKR